MKTIRNAAFAAALGLAATGGAALAQDGNDSATVYDPNTNSAYTVEKDDDDFPWGLLGLAGLAGLLGLKRREPDIHVDARRDTNNPR